ncbi:MAG TPA: hypothetical protein VH300_01370 [Thermoleophilaceae bacterium]|nr:hypothetical protein [Thermoleophilaceae bacterium]
MTRLVLGQLASAANIAALDCDPGPAGAAATVAHARACERVPTPPATALVAA